MSTYRKILLCVSVWTKQPCTIMTIAELNSYDGLPLPYGSYDGLPLPIDLMMVFPYPMDLMMVFPYPMDLMMVLIL